MVKEERLPIQERSVVTYGWILLVGSYQPVRALLTQTLSMMGYTVLGCATLSEAESLLQREDPPGLILFDEMEASEEALAQRVHQLRALLPSAARCSLLILSALHPTPRPQALPGAVQVVAKPFNLAQVLQAVTTSLEQPAA